MMIVPGDEHPLSLSDHIVEEVDDLLNNEPQRAAQILDQRILDIKELLIKGNWALGELLYLINTKKLYKFLTYERNGETKTYQSIKEYFEFGPLSFSSAWGYRLISLHTFYRKQLKVEEYAEKTGNPWLIGKLLNAGIDKLDKLKKVIQKIDQLEYWLDLALELNDDAFDLKIREAQMPTLPGGAPQVIPRIGKEIRWSSKPLEPHDLVKKTIYDLIPDLDIQEGQIVQITVQIIDLKAPPSEE